MKRILSFLLEHMEWEYPDENQAYREAYTKTEQIYDQLCELLPDEAHSLLCKFADLVTEQAFAFYIQDMEMAARAGVQLYRELLEPPDFKAK